MLITDPCDRSEHQVKLLDEFLIREFPFFKELSRETPDEAKFVSKIAKDHMTMVRTFEQKSLIEEGKFVNKEGVYMVFDGFCGIYQQKKKPLVKIDAFGKEIDEDALIMEEGEEYKEAIAQPE